MLIKRYERSRFCIDDALIATECKLAERSGEMHAFGCLFKLKATAAALKLYYGHVLWKGELILYLFALPCLFPDLNYIFLSNSPPQDWYFPYGGKHIGTYPYFVFRTTAIWEGI